MLPYIIVFLITIITTYIADKLFKREHKVLGWIFLGIGIFSLSFLAAVRDDNIGKDIPAYVIPPFKWALQFPFDMYIHIGNLEFGYMVFVYIFTKIFNNYHYILFFLQFAIELLFFIYVFKKKDKTSMLMLVCVFLFLYYNETLGMMRQGISLMACLLSFSYLQEKKYIKTVILFFIALLFHTTSILFVVPYFIIILENTQKINKRTKKIIYITFIAIIAFGIITLEPFLEIATLKLGILPKKFYDYFHSKFYVKELAVSKSILLFKFFWIVVTLFVMSKKNTKDIKLAFIFLILDLEFYIASFKLTPLMRVGYYFSLPAYMTLIPDIPKIFKNNQRNKYSINFIIFIILVCWWFFTYIIKGAETGFYPYTSEILNNLFKH